MISMRQRTRRHSMKGSVLHSWHSDGVGDAMIPIAYDYDWL